MLMGFQKPLTGPSEQGVCLGATGYSAALTGGPHSAAATTHATLSPLADGKYRVPSAGVRDLRDTVSPFH